jgi:Mrp family chromosome partitioning ATPase
MRRLVAELRGHYDVIVLDTPPVLAVSDARILSALSDMTILVVCWQRTPEKLVSTAVALLRGCGARLVGAVMTQVQLKEMTPADGVHVYGYSH